MQQQLCEVSRNSTFHVRVRVAWHGTPRFVRFNPENIALIHRDNPLAVS